MTARCEPAGAPAPAPMSVFERYLTVWVFLCIVIGIALGQFAPGDIADLDSGVEHQPVPVPGTASICVSALDAPRRFPGWPSPRLQPEEATHHDHQP